MNQCIADQAFANYLATEFMNAFTALQYAFLPFLLLSLIGFYVLLTKAFYVVQLYVEKRD